MQVDDLIQPGPRLSDWITLDASRVQAFADATDDWQFIHLDPVRAAETAFGGTVAHGFLTLSMLSAMSYQVSRGLEGVAASVNYGFDRIRFITPVPVGSRVRGRFEVGRTEDGAGWTALHWDVTIEIENNDRPALAARWIVRLYHDEQHS